MDSWVKYKNYLPNRQNLIPSPLDARGGKSAIGLIFKLANYEAKVMKLSTYVLVSTYIPGLNIRLVCSVVKNKLPCW